MNKKNITPILVLVLVGIITTIFFLGQNQAEKDRTIGEGGGLNFLDEEMKQEQSLVSAETDSVDPISIEALQAGEYLGGEFTIEEELPDGANYHQRIVSYQSEGLKIYGLLTIPKTARPKAGHSAVLFVHGYIPPKQYSTIDSYPTYQATLARAGFVTFKPDLRGHGNSEGEPTGAHFSQKYVIDTLNALAHLENEENVDPERIGYWGHSNGGEIGLRMAVVNDRIKAYSFWAGVVGSFEDMLETYNEKIPFLRNAKDNSLIKENGLPSENPDFWSRIDPHFYLEDIVVPIQLQHATGDGSVPAELSLRLKEELENKNKKVEYYQYQGDDHNISANSSLAWRRTIEFFEENL